MTELHEGVQAIVDDLGLETKVKAKYPDAKVIDVTAFKRTDNEDVIVFLDVTFFDRNGDSPPANMRHLVGAFQVRKKELSLAPSELVELISARSEVAEFRPTTLGEVTPVPEPMGAA